MMILCDIKMRATGHPP